MSKHTSINEFGVGDRVVVLDNIYARETGLTPGDEFTVSAVHPLRDGPAGVVDLEGVGPNPIDYEAGRRGGYGFLIFDIVEKAPKVEVAPEPAPGAPVYEASHALVSEDDEIKVGDRVRILAAAYCDALPATGVIVATGRDWRPSGVNTPHPYDVRVDDGQELRRMAGTRGIIHCSRVEKIEDATPEPEPDLLTFEVGDRVTMRDHHIIGEPALTSWASLLGMGATVTAVDTVAETIDVRWDDASDNGENWSPGWFQHAPEDDGLDADNLTGMDLGEGDTPRPLRAGDRVRCIQGGPGFPGLLGTVVGPYFTRAGSLKVEWDTPPADDVRHTTDPHGGPWGHSSLELVTEDDEPLSDSEWRIAELSESRDNALRHAEGLEIQVGAALERAERLEAERATLTQAASDERRRLVEEMNEKDRHIAELVEHRQQLSEERARLQEQGRADTERNAALNQQVESAKDSAKEAWAEVARLQRVIDYTRAECVDDEAARQRSFGYDDGTRSA